MKKKKPRTIDSNDLNKIQNALLDSLKEFDKIDEREINGDRRDKYNQESDEGCF